MDVHADVAALAAPVIAHARVLAAMEGSGPSGVAAQVAWEDTRAATWEQLREALRPMAEADADAVACALLVDDLRRLDESGRISGELGWAMRRWAWAELRRALARRTAG